jgi:hypothetical protein
MPHFFLPLLFATGVTLHDLEEALWLPGWMRTRTHVKTVFDPHPKAYWVGTSLVSFVVWIAALAVGIWPTVPPFHLVLSGFALAMAVNAVVPHLSMSLIQRSYMPGTATGMLFNLPLAVLLIQAELRSRLAPWASFWRQSVFYAVLLGVVAFGSLVVLHTVLGSFPKQNEPR